jgi:hypothetical protein
MEFVLESLASFLGSGKTVSVFALGETDERKTSKKLLSEN